MPADEGDATPAGLLADGVQDQPNRKRRRSSGRLPLVPTYLIQIAIVVSTKRAKIIGFYK
jgi:hypothetical protein